jgi:anti-sigma regulatory factor (Ser/Thr protein kinase)
LADQHWPAESAADCVLAVSEAVTNSVQHGYGITADRDSAPGGAVAVDGHVTRTDDEYRAVFEVRDQGRWHAPEPAAGQGYGSSIMRGCMEDVHVIGSEHGTAVSLRSRPVLPLINGSRPVNS